MKKTALLVFVFIFNYNVMAQVGGLSASKLGTLCTAVVAEGSIEFEPFFGYSISTKVFDNKGKVRPLFSTSDSSIRFSASGFRFSYGLIKNLEIGVSVPVDIREVRFGAKYKLPIEGKLNLGVLVGYNNIVGNQIYVRQNAVHELSSSFNGGIIMTYNLNDKFSIDFDAQYQKHTQINTLGHYQGFYLNTDIGYYLLDKINFIIGFNYNVQSYLSKNDNSQLLTLNTGVAIEKAENFILVLNAPFDLLGKNEYQTTGFGLALTIILH